MIEEVAVEEVTCETTMVERVTVSEHYLAVEYVPVRARTPHEAARQGASRSVA